MSLSTNAVLALSYAPLSDARQSTMTNPSATAEHRVVIIGGGPGGYEAALVARQLGAAVTVIDRDGIGGSAVLTDCVPSKALVATASVIRRAAHAGELGVVVDGRAPREASIGVDLRRANDRIRELAAAQSRDIDAGLVSQGITVLDGTASVTAPGLVTVHHADATTSTPPADTVLLATGARPRVIEQAKPDGRRILTWEQIYHLDELPERLIVVGSGVTGAEFASAYRALGSHVVLVSSRERVLPGEDPDAAAVLETVFDREGIEVLSRSRAIGAQVIDDHVIVQLEGGRQVKGSHVLLAIGSIPNTEGIGLAEAGVVLDERGFVQIDRVSRTSAPGIYAAGDCTGVLMLASVAAMQGRIAMRHALGDALAPIDLAQVSSTVFTSPEIATVGATQRDVDAGRVVADVVMLPLSSNPRAKIEEVTDGFVKLLCRRGTRTIAGAVVVGPHASELIHPLTMAVVARATVDELSTVFTVYPSLSGSIAEAARRLHVATELQH